MLEKDVHVRELYDLKHRHDKRSEEAFNYSDNILNKTLSNRMFLNPELRSFIYKLQDLVNIDIESISVIRNFNNHMVDKYYNHHNN